MRVMKRNEERGREERKRRTMKIINSEEEGKAEGRRGRGRGRWLELR